MKLHFPSLVFCVFGSTTNRGGSIVSAYTVNHTGLSFSLDVKTDPSSNPWIQKSATFFIKNDATGLTSTVDPSTVPSYGSGIGGLYNFDTYSLGGSGTFVRGTSNCSLSEAMKCPAATITGDGSNSTEIINSNGRFGSALSVPPGNSNYAQIRAGLFTRNQPGIGMAQGLWMKSSTVDSVGKSDFKDGGVTELQWNNFDITTQRYNKCIVCGLRGMNGQFRTMSCLGASAVVDKWIHVVCTYNSVTDQLTLYVNGTLASSTTATLTDDLFLHGSFQPIGIGNRPGTSTNMLQYAGSGHFEGLIDDVSFWNRALDAPEVSDLFNRNVALEPAPRVVLETENIVRVGNDVVSGNPFANEFSAVVVSWKVNDGERADSLTVEISTDSGKNWCPVTNGAVFTDKLHGGPDLICLFPSITLKIRVSWGDEQVTLTDLSAQFLDTSQLEPTWDNVAIGMNAGGVTYYISHWPFVDVFKAGGGNSWPAVRAGTDENGYPLEIDPALDAPSGTYWITGRNILMCCNNGNYPGGKYTLIAQGKGVISLAWDSGYHTISTPCRYEFNVTPTNSGMQLTIERSTAGDHVRNVQVWMPGFAPPGKPYNPSPTPPVVSPTSMSKPTVPVNPPVPAPVSIPSTTACKTCLDGIVGYWPFDTVVRDTYTSSTDGSVQLRAFSAGLTGEVAVITGTGSSPPLSDDSRFGKALVAGTNRENFAQLFGANLLQSAPATGFAASVWFKGSGGMLFERMFSNFQLDVNSNNVCCRINNAYQVCAPSSSVNTAWNHVVCSYDGVAQQLSLYLNGQGVNASATVSKFIHGDYMPLGLGNRAGSATNLGQYANDGWHFVGKIDDFALWKRPLTASEVSSIYTSGSSLADLYPKEIAGDINCYTCRDGIVSYWPFDKVSGTVSSSPDGTTVIIRGTTPSLVGANATITGSGHDSPLVSDGRFGAAFSIPSGKANWAQIFPSGLKQTAPVLGFSGSIWLRPASVTFSGAIFERMFDNFDLLSLSDNSLRCSIRGTDGKEYYARYNINGGGPLDVKKWIHAVCTYDGASKTLKLFVDGQEKAASIANLTDGKFQHGDAQPLGLGNRAGSLTNPAQYAGTSHFVGAVDDFALWNRSLTSGEVQKLYASGKPLSLQGQERKTPSPTRTPTASPTTASPTTHPTSPPTTSPTSSPTKSPTLAPADLTTFHPEYLKSLKNFEVIRFMDWGRTNGAQHSKWSRRNTPKSVGQAHQYTVTRQVSSISSAAGTAFLGNRAVMVSTVEPHDFVTGQLVSISNSNGYALMTNGQTSNFDTTETMVEVVDDHSFLMNYGPWWWDASYVAQEITPGDRGTVSVGFSPGVSLEYQVELCNALGADGWFNVPHLADDDYIFNMARLINETLAPNRKAYIEYSNEVWNWIFTQTRYASNKAMSEGDTTGNRHLTWYGRKAAHVFSIFDGVFGSLARERLVRVVAVQAGGGSDALSQVGIGGADVLAIGPYFGSSLNGLLYNTPGWQNITIDQVLDLARELVVSETLSRTKSSVKIAQSYGMKLVAYEGGQHFGGGGSCGSDDCSNVSLLQAKFMAANHSPRMKGLYKNMLKAWSMGGGSTFVAFSHIGYDSKYGSWGALQHQMEDRSIAWKWQALVENIGKNSTINM